MTRDFLVRFLRRPSVIVLLALAVLLVALRIVAPVLATRYANNVLADLPGHVGEVEDVDLHLWRGGISVYDIRVDEVKNEKLTPIFNANTVDVSIQWRPLFRGQLVGKVFVESPKLNFVASPDQVEEEKLQLEAIVRQLEGFLPFNVNRFRVTDGEVRFRDPTLQTPIDIYVDQIEVLVQNLTNSESAADNLWASMSASGRLMGSGDVRLEMRFNPTEPTPTYEAAFRLKDLRLTALNDYLRYYLSVQARDGRLSLTAESTAENGRFKGYAKPIVEDLDILQIKPDKPNPMAVVKGFFVKVFANIFENSKKEQIATRVNLSGSFQNPQIGVWDAVIMFVRNAFVQALAPGLDASVAPRQAEKAKRLPPPGKRGDVEGEK